MNNNSKKENEQEQSFIQKIINNIGKILNFIYLYFTPIILIYSLYHYSPSLKKINYYLLYYLVYIYYIYYLSYM